MRQHRVACRAPSLWHAEGGLPTSAAPQPSAACMCMCMCMVAPRTGAPTNTSATTVLHNTTHTSGSVSRQCGSTSAFNSDNHAALEHMQSVKSSSQGACMRKRHTGMCPPQGHSAPCPTCSGVATLLGCGAARHLLHPATGLGLGPSHSHVGVCTRTTSAVTSVTSPLHPEQWLVHVTCTCLQPACRMASSRHHTECINNPGHPTALPCCATLGWVDPPQHPPPTHTLAKVLIFRDWGLP